MNSMDIVDASSYIDLLEKGHFTAQENPFQPPSTSESSVDEVDTEKVQDQAAHDIVGKGAFG